MYLQWFLASVMITSTNGVTRIFKPDLQALNFAKQIRGRRLNGSVIRQIEVDSDVSCQLQCVEQNGCLSYNFGPYENKKKFKCQLSNSDRFFGSKNFTEDHEFLYRGVQVHDELIDLRYCLVCVLVLSSSLCYVFFSLCFLIYLFHNS